MINVHQIEFEDYHKSVSELLDRTELSELITGHETVCVTPNLVNESPFPVTTPSALCREIIVWLKKNFRGRIVIAEGTGSVTYTTEEIFSIHGYDSLAAELDVDLINLNTSESVLIRKEGLGFFPEFYMPKIIMDSFLISVPVLKAHSLAVISGTLKNMMGCAQPEHCQAGGHWKKSLFHSDMHTSIRDLNEYRTPDYSIMDATVGLADYHLGGRQCMPPVNKLIASEDAVAMDRYAAQLLGRDWRKTPHLQE